MRKLIYLAVALVISSGAMPLGPSPASAASLGPSPFVAEGGEYAQLRAERRDVRRARRELRGERRDLRRATTARERRIERRQLQAARRDLRRERRDVRDVRRGRRGYGRRGRASGAAVAAGVVGSLVGGAITASQSGGRAVNNCESRFRSYDRRSGTYLGNDGSRHACP